MVKDLYLVYKRHGGIDIISSFYGLQMDVSTLEDKSDQTLQKAEIK